MVHLWDGRRPGERLVPGPGELRERWRCRSAETGWALTGDWWTPAVESVVSAACGEPGLAAACKRLGEARGRAGVGIGETLEDLGALFAELNWPDPPLSLVRCAAEGWADGGTPESPDVTCEDPLTGLMTASYLRSRLTELYREAGGVPDGHTLLFVDLPEGDEPWRRLSRSLVVAHELREVFRRGETVAFTGPARAAALIPAGRRAEADAVVLRHLLEQALGASDETELFHSLFGTNGFGVRLAPLPEDLRTALALLEPSAS
ncbi:hypothetical protein BTM25_09680 [Actinomadura rubteroloni]|uniref:Uncharacterized protein n=1 Tax=Actinomadura rubteroloni TaxID=1926885 RepID=A0A2P4UNE7_9ACTN|nr:hypothetical protein [Actinomadura rubteroloni]POM26567.1 hypothetical protein BTM25_09680 [Actinomadura rubteroloni]